ncbi:unnamed protein product, partial [Mycena citricolor]
MPVLSGRWDNSVPGRRLWVSLSDNDQAIDLGAGFGGRGVAHVCADGQKMFDTARRRSRIQLRHTHISIAERRDHGPGRGLVRGQAVALARSRTLFSVPLYPLQPALGRQDR